MSEKCLRNRCVHLEGYLGGAAGARSTTVAVIFDSNYPVDDSVFEFECNFPNGDESGGGVKRRKVLITMMVKSGACRGGRGRGRMRRSQWQCKLNTMCFGNGGGGGAAGHAGMWLLCFTLLAQFTNGLIEGHSTEKEKQGECVFVFCLI